MVKLYHLLLSYLRLLLSLWTKTTNKIKLAIISIVSFFLYLFLFHSKSKNKRESKINFDSIKKIEDERQGMVKLMIKGDINEKNKNEIINELNRNSFNN